MDGRHLHHDDKFNDIPLNIIGREKQLFKPILRIFNNTDTQKELEDVISNYINERRAANVDSQHAFIFRRVVKLIKEIGSHELTSKDIWGEVTTVPGEFLYRGNTKFESVDYGLLTQKLVTKICKEVLGAKPSRDNTKRKLVFNPKKLGRLNQLFNLSLVLKVTHVTDVTHSGLTKYVKWAEDKKENEYIDTKNNDNYNIANENNQNIINTNDKDTKEHSGKASHVSPTSPVCPTSESKPRVQTSCSRCGYTDDAFYMKNHCCEGTD